jgi:biopolymer transport protein ExbB/TolQ
MSTTSREDRNLKTFVASLAIAFSFYLLFSWNDHAWPFRVAAGLLVASLAWQGWRGETSETWRSLYWTLIAALCLGVIAPFLAGESPAAALRTALNRAAIWPQALVALFTARALAAENTRHLASMRARPLAAAQRLRGQSYPGAIALGAFLCICVGLSAQHESLFGASRATAILFTAAAGSTPIHTAILVLFFFLIAVEADALWSCAKDHFSLARLRQKLARCGIGSATTLASQYAQIIADDAERYGYSAAVELLRDSTRTELPALLVFRAASRRFARNLLPLLPLLGFLGTVVGLAISLADLQAGLTPGGGANISGSLAGLAIKFETTILGLLANIVGLLLLNLCDKCEADLVAQCDVVADAIAPQDGGGDALSQ